MNTRRPCKVYSYTLELFEGGGLPSFILECDALNNLLLE